MTIIFIISVFVIIAAIFLFAIAFVLTDETLITTAVSPVIAPIAAIFLSIVSPFFTGVVGHNQVHAVGETCRYIRRRRHYLLNSGRRIWQVLSCPLISLKCGSFSTNRGFQRDRTGLISLQEYVTEATPAIERALKLDNALPEGHAELATLRWLSGDIDAAETSFKAALELGPGDSQSLYSYGIFLRATGRSQEAFPVLKRAVEANPLSVETLFALGTAEMYSGHPEQFIVRAQKILEIDSSSMNGYVANLLAYEWMGRFDLMWPWYIKAMASDPEDFELWGFLGLYSYFVGADEWVDRYMERALELGPHEPTVLRCYVSILRSRDQFDTAVEIARNALEAGLADRWRSDEIFLRLVRDDALRSGNHEDAKSWYLDRHPELFLDVPEISKGNVNVAVELAVLLQHAGEPAAAAVIIDAGLAWIRRTQPEGLYGYLINIAGVELLAVAGQKQAALDKLQEAVDSGWRMNWRTIFRNETLISLRDEPRFQQITAQLENDMATQLEAIRALPYMGEFDLRFAKGN